MDRHKLIPAAYLLLERDGKIALLRRFNTGFKDGSYTLISGHVDEGESFTQAIAREAKEEAGIDVAIEDLKMIHMVHSHNEDGSERVDAFFVVSKWIGQITNMEPQKCDDLSWFDKKSLPENIIPKVKFALDEISKNEFYSEMGWD